VPLNLPHPGRPDALADGVDELRKVVRSLLRAGAAVIKICTTGGVLSPRDDPRHSQFSPAEIDVVVAEAAAAGRMVMAHAQGAVGIKNAVRAGVRSIEHGSYLDEEAIELMLAHNTWLVPTLVAPRAVVAAAASGAGLSEAVVARRRR
jgi:imidazolonepropionase-like amidohydrolase